MLSEAAKARALRRGPGFLGFLLAHHFTGELDHCYQIWLGGKPVWLCSRCLGLYPVLLLVLGTEFYLTLGTAWYDPVWLFVLPIPALVDWGLSRFDLWSGKNWIRTLTGALMGASLARTIYLNFQYPAEELVMIQIACLVVFVAGVELISRLRAAHIGNKKGFFEEQGPEERRFEQ